MRRIGVIGTFILALAAQVGAAEESSLRQLSTSDDSKGWEAVGRLNIGKRSFCTGALIAPDLVLTAAHCMYDKRTGAPYDLDEMEFLAGWRNGRAEAYRGVSKGVVHPDYNVDAVDKVKEVAHDLALLQLDMPIRLPGIKPFATSSHPRKGDEVGVVSYAKSRSEAPSLQELCHVLAGRPGVVMLSCNVDFGSSGAPVFAMRDGEPQIVSVVSSKADLETRKVALGTSLDNSLDVLQARLAAGDGILGSVQPVINRFGQGTARTVGGAKFMKP